MLEEQAVSTQHELQSQDHLPPPSTSQTFSNHDASKPRLHPSTRKPLTNDLIIALRLIIAIFLKTILHLNLEEKLNEQKKIKLTELEQISWDAVLEISKTYIGGDHTMLADDLVIKVNLAHFFVKSIETPEVLIHEDLSPLIRSCLIHNPTTQSALIEETLKFIVELEAHRFSFSSNQGPHGGEEIDELDASCHLFEPQSGQTPKDLSRYFESLDCPIHRVGDHKLSLLSKIAGSVSEEIVSHSEHPEDGRRRFSVLHLTKLCLSIIRQLVQQDTKLTSKFSWETQNKLTNLSGHDSLKIPHNSSSSSTSNDSDEFQAEILIENPSPVKPTQPTPQRLNQKSHSDEFLASISRITGLDLTPENGFEERHHRAVGLDSSGQGLICKQLRELMERSPDIFLKKDTTPTKNPTRTVQVTRSLKASDRPLAELADPVSLSSPIKGIDRFSKGRNPSTAQASSSKKETSSDLRNHKPSTSRAASAALPQSPIRHAVAFCFNAPQEHASQIEFESFPTVEEASSLPQDHDLLDVQNQEPRITEVPSVPVEHDHQTSSKDDKNADVRPASKSKSNPSNHRTIFHPVTSGFLPSSSKESSPATSQVPLSQPLKINPAINQATAKVNHDGAPPLRGRRVIHVATTVEHAQSPDNLPELPDLNDARSLHSEVDAKQSQKREEVIKSHQGHKSERSMQPDSEDSPSNVNRQNQRSPHKEKHKSTSPSPIPVRKRKRKSSEVHPDVLREQEQESTSPSPIPLAKRKRKTSEDQPVKHKRRSSVADSRDQKHDQRMKRSPSKLERSFWTPEEEKLLIKEVEKHYQMKNCMAHIISRHGRHGTLSKTFSHRTSVNLKDKAINLSTRWYTNRTHLSEKRQKAFARFPPKGRVKYETESEHSSSSSASSSSSSDESDTSDESEQQEKKKVLQKKSKTKQKSKKT